MLYRTSQFWHALKAAPAAEDLQRLRGTLAPPLLALFLQQQASEQAHSLQVFNRLLEAGETDPDLLPAALLHDVGKSRHPLRVWERVLIVLGQALMPGWVDRLGAGKAHGWKRLFAVARQHPAWGAQMVEAAGASPLTVELVRRHQERLAAPPASAADRLLSLLQKFDNES
jgi:hypothetical protein